jgi:hypothetical protein
MKTLTSPSITVKDDTLTLTCRIEDLPFSNMITRRVSHLHINPDNVRHPRMIESNDQAVFLTSQGARVVMPNTFFAALMAAVEPATTFTPVFHPDSKPGNVKIISEIPYTLQWQVSDHEAFQPNDATKGYAPPVPAVWTDVAGETNAVLDDSKIPAGKWVRCVATNAAGKTITRPVKKSLELPSPAKPAVKTS